MDRRVEEILVTLAQQYAPGVLQVWDRRGDYPERLPRLARALADHGVLVLMGDFPYSLQNLNQDVGSQIQTWVNNYGQFYSTLAGRLFPSLIHLSAHWTDERWPVIVYMVGRALPVIQRMAGYVVPFVVQRQLSPLVSEAELAGLMDWVLDELEAISIPRDDYKRLRGECASIIKQMLSAQIRQMALTEFDQQIITASQRFVPLGDLPPMPPAPPPAQPPVVPEEDSQLMRVNPAAKAVSSKSDTETLIPTQAFQEDKEPEPPAAQENPFGSPIPIFFSRKDGDKKRPPPLPRLPKDGKR